MQEHPLVKRNDAGKIKESEIPQLWRWLGKDMIEGSFAISAEEIIGVIRDGDMDNMHMRVKHIVEADPHYRKPLPEPTEQQIWEKIMQTPNFTKVFLNTTDETKKNLVQIASDSGMLRGIQRFHHHLNENLTAHEQTEEVRWWLEDPRRTMSKAMQLSKSDYQPSRWKMER